jgi:hypothetical protein
MYVLGVNLASASRAYVLCKFIEFCVIPRVIHVGV